MDVSFRTKNVSLSNEDRESISQKLAHLDHVFDGFARCEVRFYQERNPRISEREVCEVTIHTRNNVVRAKASGIDSLAATDRVIERLEHRLEKVKGKLIQRSHPHHRALKVETSFEPEEMDGTMLSEIALLGGARIVRSKSFSVPEMSAMEAALQMQLLSHSFYVFTNAETGRAAVVYQREDGDVGLIDSVEAK